MTKWFLFLSFNSTVVQCKFIHVNLCSQRGLHHLHSLLLNVYSNLHVTTCNCTNQVQFGIMLNITLVYKCFCVWPHACIYLFGKEFGLAQYLGNCHSQSCHGITPFLFSKQYFKIVEVTTTNTPSPSSFNGMSLICSQLTYPFFLINVLFSPFRPNNYRLLGLLAFFVFFIQWSNNTRCCGLPKTTHKKMSQVSKGYNSNKNYSISVI